MKSRKQDTRIEVERAGRHGGYTQILFGTIDDVTDARANCPHEEGGRLRRQVGSRLCPSPNKRKHQMPGNRRRKGKPLWDVEVDGEGVEDTDGLVVEESGFPAGH